MENTQQEYYRKIRYLEVISKALIAVFFCAIMLYVSVFSCDYVVCFGKPINLHILSLPFLIIAVFLEIIALLFRKKYHLLIKNPAKKFLKFLLFFLIFSSLFSILFYSPCGSRAKARDAKRASDIRQINAVCERYYSDVDKYPVYSNFAALKEGGIGDYMKVDDMGSSVPDDPREGSVYHYIWIDNTGAGEDQHFCVYAKLESVSVDTWVVGSEKGNNYNATREPTGLGDACW